MMKKILPLLLLLLPLLTACGGTDTALSEAERAAFIDLFADEDIALNDISAATLTNELQEKFPAVTKVYTTAEGDWAVIAAPVAYNGPIIVAVAIDGATHESLGIRIVEHLETPHYVRDMESGWFIGRYSGKSVRDTLELVHQNAFAGHQIVAITGATVSTQAVTNGVNSALGAYRETVLAEQAEPVELAVRFTPGEGDGPVETGSLAIRAYGLVIGEISLEEIRELPSVKRVMTIHSTLGETSHSFRGTLLSNILDLLDPGLIDEYDYVMTVGVDDYISGLRMDEVAAENSVFVMYEDNGEPLPMKDGQPGGMRIVVLDDIFGQRFTNYLLEIELEKEGY